MKRRAFVVAVDSTFLIALLIAGALPTAVYALSAPGVHRIGYLTPFLPNGSTIDVFRQGLRDYGYVEGQKLAAKHRLPAEADLSEFVDGGGLISYEPRLSEELRRTAAHVDKILKGAKLPVEQPSRIGLVVNTKTAKVLGVTIPPAVLARPTR